MPTEEPDSKPARTRCPACGHIDVAWRATLQTASLDWQVTVLICPHCGTLRAAEPQGR